MTGVVQRVLARGDVVLLDEVGQSDRAVVGAFDLVNSEYLDVLVDLTLGRAHGSRHVSGLGGSQVSWRLAPRGAIALDLLDSSDPRHWFAPGLRSPVPDTTHVRLPPLAGGQRESWHLLAELAPALGERCRLVGGQPIDDMGTPAGLRG